MTDENKVWLAYAIFCLLILFVCFWVVISDPRQKETPIETEHYNIEAIVDTIKIE